VYSLLTDKIKTQSYVPAKNASPTDNSTWNYTKHERILTKYDNRVYRRRPKSYKKWA